MAHPIRFVLVSALLVALSGAPTLAQEAGDEKAAAPAASERHGKRFKDWTLRCGRPKGGEGEVCEMYQELVNDKNEPVLLAVVGKLAGKTDPGMVIMLPLGISLPPGIILQIDDSAEIKAPIERCEPRGCRVELLLKPELLALLKKGTRAGVVFTTYEAPGKRKPVGITISLLGFTAALNEVMK